MHVGDHKLYRVMTRALSRFSNARRGAVAVIFAISIVPMVLLVGLCIDYAFYVQARAQTLAAADAAAMNAVRAAANVYAYETYPANKASYTNPSGDAVKYGEKIGQLWFDAALGIVPTSTVPFDPPVTVTQNGNGTTGFAATVNFTGTYPPFFNTLFGHSNTNKWNLNGSSTATSNYNFVEILLLLDNSSSMLIGASGNTTNNANLTNIQAVENLAVCPPAKVQNAAQIDSWAQYNQNVPKTGASAVNQSGWENYKQPSSKNGEGTCTSSSYGDSGSPNAPCAFACHTTTTAYNGYSADLYGLVQADPNMIQLRLNVVQSAASAVITSLQASEQSLNQFSVGIYEFNTDVSAVYPNNGSNESGFDLTTASSDIGNATPPLTTNPNNGNTDFRQSVSQLVCGSSGTKNLALKAGGNGSTVTAPQKDIFIVTDGMEDNSDSGSRIEGEMTSYGVENAAAKNLVVPCPPPSSSAVTPALCAQLKALNFTVYVLYIDYSSLPDNFFAALTGPKSQFEPETAYTAADYTKGSIKSEPTIDYALPADQSTDTSFSKSPPAGSTTSVTDPSPDEVGLEACASTPQDFVEAANDGDIETDLQVLLHSALTSTIQVTQ